MEYGYVALRKESVDRNVESVVKGIKSCTSLSARRAWIEIGESVVKGIKSCVALRKESVDRNTMRRDFKSLGLLSLSARRAWIEIISALASYNIIVSRSPQGERG